MYTPNICTATRVYVYAFKSIVNKNKYCVCKINKVQKGMYIKKVWIN